MRFLKERKAKRLTRMNQKKNIIEILVEQLNKSSNIILIFAGVLLIVFAGVYRLQEQHAPVILMDEFGYWSNAAFFAGRDWSDISQFNSYYSYGYSILLSFVIRFFANTAYMYKLAIVINILCVCMVFFMLIKIGKIVFPDVSDNYVILASLLSILYPSIFANMHIAWCETLLVFNFTLIVYFIVRYSSEKKRRYIFFYTLACFFCYITHQRALGVLCVGVLLLFILFLFKHIDKKTLFFCLLFFVLLMVIHKIVKGNILECVFAASSNENAKLNDYGSIIDHVLYWLNFEGMRRLFFSVSGKIFYLLIGSMGIIGFSFVFIFNSLKDVVIKRKLQGIEAPRFFVALFLLLSIISTILISAVFTLNGNRLDTLVYGRYTEWMITPFILIGFIYGVANKEKLTKMVLYTIISIIGLGMIILTEYKGHTEWNVFYDVCSYVMAYFRSKIEHRDFTFVIYSICITNVFLFLYVLKSLSKNKYLYLCVLYILCIAPNTYWCVERAFAANYRSEICLKMDESIGETENVYFVNDYGEGLWYIADLQVMNPDLDLISIIPDEVQNVKGYLLAGTYDPNVNVHKDIIGEAIVSNFQISLYCIE